jgi:autotransporter translocation and assembly factor TamB
MTKAQKLSGPMHGELKINGNLANPVISGKMHLKSGYYRYNQYGIVINEATADISAKNNKLYITNFKVFDQQKNFIEGTGNIEITKDLTFEALLHTNKFSPMSTEYLSGAISGSIKIQGNARSAVLSGDLTVDPLKISLLQRLSSPIPYLNIVNDKTIISNVKNYEFTTDLHITCGKNVFINGWGIESLLSGSLNIQDNISNPKIYGQLKSVKGKYREFGKMFDINNGLLEFSGTIPPSPFLNITGVIKEQDVEIKLKLYNSITDPKIKISSVPPMSTEDALSTLLFGKNSQTLNPFQGIQLASSIQRISNNNQGINFIDASRKLLRIDDINIRNNNNPLDKNDNTSSISIGKRIGNKLYLEIEKNIDSGDTSSKLEVEIFRHMTIENTVNSKGQSSVGVNWKLDY